MKSLVYKSGKQYEKDQYVLLPIKLYNGFLGIDDKGMYAKPQNDQLLTELKKVRSNIIHKIRDMKLFTKIIDIKMKEIDFHRVDKNGN